MAEQQAAALELPDAGPVVDTLAGAMNFQGYRNGKAQDAKFFYPSGVVQDKDGTIYVADTLNHVIRRISPSGLVDTLAGLGKDPGYRNGQGDGARFRNPVGLAMDASGLLYVGDLGNNLIRTVTKDGVVGTFAGQAGVGGMIDGPAHSATFEEPSYLAFGPSGDLYVSDPGNRAIRKVTPQGVVSTVDSNDGSKGMLYVAMTGLGVDAQGLLWVADGDSIRTIDADGKVETPASGFTFIADLAVLPGAAGVVVAGGVNGTIKQVSPSGKVEVVAGNPLVRGVDAGPLSNGLDVPMGIAVTPDGDLLVAVSGGVVQITAPAPAGAPAVTVVPQKGRVDDTAVFKAEARGRAPFTYVWQVVRPGKDPETLVGENKAYLAHRVGAGDDGTAYQVTVTDGDKISVTSSPARLTVLP
jgi:sugar lactone lactonase YvrE